MINPIFLQSSCLPPKSHYFGGMTCVLKAISIYFLKYTFESILPKISMTCDIMAIMKRL